jgi:hypothetical protein
MPRIYATSSLPYISPFIPSSNFPSFIQKSFSGQFAHPFPPLFLFLIIKRAKLAQNPENYSGKFQLVRGSKYLAQIPLINLLTNKLDIYFCMPLL